jgi:outer membrane receptor protein involved in Fe transport
MKNVGKVEIYGLEGEIKYDLSENFSAFANYTFTHAKVKENVINDPQIDYDLRGKYLTDVPDHKVSAGFTWKSRFVSATIRYKYIGRQWINDLNVVDEDYLLTDRYPAYSVVSLRLERRILKSLKGAVNVENLFDRKYTDGNAQQCPGRFVMVSLTFAF